MGIASALSNDTPVSCPPYPTAYLNDGLQHLVDQGTSMAAPHVTGAVALLLQQFGAMTPAQVKSFLTSHAITDAYTGPVWNRYWGNGKLHLSELSDPMVHVESPNGGESYVIGLAKAFNWNASDLYPGVASVDLELSRDNGASYQPIARGVPNTGWYNWTVTGPTATAALFRVTARDSAGNQAIDRSDAPFAITTGPAETPPPGAILDFALSILSPSPAPGSVEIEFAVPRAASVDVGVFDLLGRKVATLASGPHGIGRYHARWGGGSGRDPARSGIYFVRMRAARREFVRRVVMVR